MKKRLILAALLAMAGGDPAAIAKGPPANGQDIIDYLQHSGYQNWPLWPGKTRLYPGRHPHGALLTTYVSQGAHQAILGKKGRIPTGEFIVKENYKADRTLEAVTVMYKLDGYNADGGDWFWLKFAADGVIQKEGKVGACLGCHAAVRTNDWLFIGPVK